MILKEVAPDWLAQLIDYWIPDRDLPVNCYLMGRLVVHHEHSFGLVGAIIASAHLTWRAYQAITPCPYQLSYIFFILQPREDIQTFLGHMRAREKEAEFKLQLNGQNKATNIQDDNHHPLRYVRQLKTTRSSRLLAEMHLSGAKREISSTSLDELVGFSAEEVHAMSNREQFLYKVMCCKAVRAGTASGDDDCYEQSENDQDDDLWDLEEEFEDNQPIDLRISFMLRPNRSLEAHSEQVHLLAQSSIYSTCLFLILAILMFLTLGTTVLLHRRYLNVYAGCDPALKEAYDSGNLSAWSLSLVSSYSDSYHHLISFLADFVENFVIWFESGVAVVYVLVFIVLVNNDLLSYWSHTHQRIQKTLNIVKRHHMCSSMASSFYHNDHDEKSHHDRRRDQRLLRTISSHFQKDSKRGAELGVEVRQLQVEMHDFFEQVISADVYMSGVVTVTLFIWTTGIAVIVIMNVKYASASQAGHLDILNICVGLVSLGCFSMTSLLLLTLQRGCSKSYVSICSLMAYDQSKYKRYFMRILDYYTTKNRTCYTIIHRYPYTTTTYFSVIGWTISSYLILDSFFRH